MMFFSSSFEKAVVLDTGFYHSYVVIRYVERDCRLHVVVVRFGAGLAAGVVVDNCAGVVVCS